MRRRTALMLMVALPLMIGALLGPGEVPIICGLLLSGVVLLALYFVTRDHDVGLIETEISEGEDEELEAGTCNNECQDMDSPG